MTILDGKELDDKLETLTHVHVDLLFRYYHK
jgi:hypothetical protein